MNQPKPTGCVKTGAIVCFPQYNHTFSADLFRVGNCIVVQTRPDQVGGEQQDYFLDKEVDAMITSNGGDEYWEKSRGVFVVPEESIILRSGI